MANPKELLIKNVGRSNSTRHQRYLNPGRKQTNFYLSDGHRVRKTNRFEVLSFEVFQRDFELIINAVKHGIIQIADTTGKELSLSELKALSSNSVAKSAEIKPVIKKKEKLPEEEKLPEKIEKDISKLSYGELTKLAKELNINSKGVKKDELVKLILDSAKE